jgi:hypothetical protein
MIPPVAASDRGAAQTAFVTLHPRGCRTAPLHIRIEGKPLERGITEGDNPVPEVPGWHSGILSSAGHVKSCVNLPGPSGKAKYSNETDSEPVP